MEHTQEPPVTDGATDGLMVSAGTSRAASCNGWRRRPLMPALVVVSRLSSERATRRRVAKLRERQLRLATALAARKAFWEDRSTLSHGPDPYHQ